jgi:hypothetical protein
MRAIVELEALGFRCSLNEGTISYKAPESADPLVSLFYLRRIQRHKDEAIAYIRANNAVKEFARVYEQWQQDPTGNDANYASRLAEIAITGKMPFYEDGINDAGPSGWRRWASQALLGQSFKQEVKEEERTAIRLPWQ